MKIDETGILKLRLEKKGKAAWLSVCPPAFRATVIWQDTPPNSCWNRKDLGETAVDLVLARNDSSSPPPGPDL